MYSCLTQQELIQFRTKGGKLKQCELTLNWPEKMKFTAAASNRVTAERMAAALACLKLKVTNILILRKLQKLCHHIRPVFT